MVDSGAPQEGWQVRRLGPRLRLFQAEGERFKTCTLRVYLHAPLEVDTVTATALVPQLLGRGCEGYPDLTAIQRRREQLYGASVGAGVGKAGEVQSVFLGMDAVADRYLPPGSGVLSGAVDLLARLLLRPALDADGHFPAETVAQEKENLARHIRGLLNDKDHYASLRCVEAMCAGEPYALNGSGRLEDLDRLNAAALTQRWRSLVDQAPIDVFVVGGGGLLVDLVTQALEPLASGSGTWPATHRGPTPASPRRVTERESMQQAKLCMGYRTEITRGHPLYAGMLLATGILGGFPHSKLFRNVREKASLAYYAHAHWDSLKGLVLVASGIEAEKYGQAEGIITAQLEDLAAGRFDADELEFTRLGLTNGMRAALDSPYAMIDTAEHQALAGPLRPLPERLAEIAAAGREEVVAAARTITLDTIYLLHGLADDPPTATEAGGEVGAATRNAAQTAPRR